MRMLEAIGAAGRKCRETGNRQYIVRNNDERAEWFVTEQLGIDSIRASYEVNREGDNIVLLDYSDMTEYRPY